MSSTVFQHNSGMQIAVDSRMRYKVTFRKRFNAQGDPADDPKSLVSPPDGVVEDEEFVEIIEPAGLGVAEDLNEGSGSQESNDNGFLALGTETWVYDIAEGREKEFTDTLVESRVVLDFEEVPDESLTT
ncbi:MAG: hypothetical protein C5B51_19075 [Terriglobia bacterium]|nr:MAG: hypothetical protein C5B51_19075 [Terriglobia bacterium]